jgi:hypothetical protein
LLYLTVTGKDTPKEVARASRHRRERAHVGRTIADAELAPDEV